MKRKDGRRVPRITISSTDVEILQRCKEILGGYFCKRADKRKNVRQAYIYVLQGQAVLDFATAYWDRFSQPVKRARARHLCDYHLALTKAKIANFEREFYRIAADYGYQTRVQL